MPGLLRELIPWAAQGLRSKDKQLGTHQPARPTGGESTEGAASASKARGQQSSVTCVPSVPTVVWQRGEANTPAECPGAGESP